MKTRSMVVVAALCVVIAAVLIIVMRSQALVKETAAEGDGVDPPHTTHNGKAPGNVHGKVGSSEWVAWYQTLSPIEQSRELSKIEKSMYPSAASESDWKTTHIEHFTLECNHKIETSRWHREP